MNSSLSKTFTCPITHCSSNFSNAQTLHTHVNSNKIRDENVPDTYYKSFNRSFCQSCNKSYCLARNHNCKGLTQSQMQPIIDDLLDNSDPNISSDFNIPEINEILNSKIPIRKHIPKMCRDLFAEALTTLFRNISQNPIEMNFRLLTLFPRAVLHLPTRSGKNKRVQSARILNDRLKRWISGEHYFLWSETKREADKYSEHKKSTNTKNNIDRAINLTQEGNFGKACKALLSNGMADASQDIISTLQDKHPKRLHPIDIPSTQTNSSIQFTTKEVMFMLDSFPVASGSK